jgi:quinoprotein glucose dehydrogenase
MRRYLTAVLLAVGALSIVPAQQASVEITRENVSRLQVAWTYRTGESDPRFATTKPASFEATPIVVDDTMYVGTPLGRVIALDPATGRERWVFDPQIARNIPYGDFANRGVSSWLDQTAPANGPCRRRIFAATAQSQLIALDGRDGRPCRDFGDNGIVDLKTGLRIPPFEPQAYSITSPPAVVNDMVITGSSIGDNSRPDPASGEVRAYDARTGRLRWTWDPIPQDSADPAYPEWRGAVAHKGGGANAWSTLVADAERDLVLVPTGSAAPDYYGALRLGDNRYANSVVALRATTLHRPRWSRSRATAAPYRWYCRPRRPGCSSYSTVKPAGRSFRSKNAPFPRVTFPASRPLLPRFLRP